MLRLRFAASLTVVTGLVSALAAGAAGSEPAGMQKVATVEGITEYRLDNGLKVLLFPDDSKPTVTVNLTIFVGSRHEGYGEAGMAHLLEHMLFKGTPTHPEIPRILQGRGAQFNGTTWLDRTNYFETLPASDENLEFALRLEADRMVNSKVAAEDLTSEMTVVRNEFEAGENSPRSILLQRMMAVAFEWHNYGKSTIGNRADIERVPIEKLREFYRRHYQPDNAMLIVAGRFEPDKALESIGKHFGSIPRPDRQLDATYTEEPAQDGERIVTLRRVGDVALVGALYHVPAGPHPEYPAVDVLQEIMTARPAGRLYKALVETKKAANVSGAAFALHDPGVLFFLAEVTKGNEPQVVLESMLDAIEEVVEKGVTPEEVERARTALLKDRELAAAESRDLAIDLSEWAAQGDWRLYFLYRDRLEDVSPDAVHSVAKEYLDQNNRTVGLFLPTKQPQRVSIPATPELAEMIGDYKGRETIAAGEVFDVSPESIEKRTTRHTLDGGVRAAFLPKKTRGGAVTLRLTLRYGNEQNLRGLAKAAEFLPTLMTRGTQKLSRQKIQDELDKLRADLNAAGTPGEATFTVETKREHFAAVLDLLRQILREATLSENELEILRRASLAGLEQQLTQPQALAVNEVRRRLSPYPEGDPRYYPTIEEDIEQVQAVTRSDLARLYQEYLSGRHGELVIVGDFDPDETLPVVTSMLDGWEPGAEYAHLSRTGKLQEQGGSREFQTPDKPNAMYFAGTALPMKDTDPDFPTLELGNFILGSSGLSSRLGDRVRQQEGLSYGIGSGLNASAVDRRTTFYVYAIANPGNIPKVKQAIREELERLLTDGVRDDELAEARQGYLEEQQVARTNDAGLAAILAENLHAGRGMEFYARLEKQIRESTPAAVQAALQKHIRPDDLYVVTAGDFGPEK
ncbi:MAG TPA: pitrilysin family protein [Planctomycetaceae bacterium]|nr:pitrilysin family protein [Planctomycetaceae bacterium]